MERPFIKRDTKNQKSIAGGSLSPMILDYIMDSEIPRPCRHFVGREDVTTELHSLLEDNSKVFLYGIAGIGKSELAKSYAKQYKKHYTILFRIAVSKNKSSSSVLYSLELSIIHENAYFCRNTIKSTSLLIKPDSKLSALSSEKFDDPTYAILSVIIIFA